MNGEEQQYPPQYIAPTGQMSEGILQYQLDSSEIINDVVNSLSGKMHVFNQTTSIMEWKENSNSVKHINEKGMAAILVPLQSVVSKVFILSDFDTEQIDNMTIEIAHNMIDHLYEHWEEYEIKSISSGSLIVETITNAVYASLNKAKNHNYLTFLKTAQRIHEIQQIRGGIQPIQQPQSKLSRIPVLGKMFK